MIKRHLVGSLEETGEDGEGGHSVTIRGQVGRRRRMERRARYSGFYFLEWGGRRNVGVDHSVYRIIDGATKPMTVIGRIVTSAASVPLPWKTVREAMSQSKGGILANVNLLNAISHRCYSFSVSFCNFLCSLIVNI